jgi:hypothetical protein
MERPFQAVAPGHRYTWRRVANPHDEHAHGAVLDAGDDAIVTHPVLPELSQPGSLDGLSDAPWIVQRANAVMQERQDTPRRLLVEPAQIPAPQRGQVRPSTP